MTVQCPRCRTQYKIPSARINDPRPVFKCTRCSLVFSSETERGPRPGRAKEDRNLPLPFASRKERGTRGRRSDDEEQPQIAGEDDPTVQSDLDELEDEVAGDADGEDEESSDGATDDADEDEDEAADDDEEEEDEAPPARRRATRPREARASDKDAPEPAFVTRAARERERAAAERERAAAERERAAAERERERAVAEKERERERAAAERARAAAAAKRRANRDELRLRDDEDLEDDGPSEELSDEDDEPRRPVLSASEGKQRRPPINPRRGVRSASAAASGRSPLRPILIGVSTIAIVYVALALALDRRSEAAIETLSKVPVLGRLLGGDHLLVWRLQLADVDGGLDQIKGARPAYVVSGRALNTTNEDLRVIEIEGRLLANGNELRRQTVYAANQQRKTIQDLSPSEVEMLLRLEPNRRFVIRPGESASFLLVFPNPPANVTEVTCRVVNARTS